MLSRNGLQGVGCKVWSICRKSQWLKLGRAFEDSFFPGKGGGRGGGGAEFEQTSPQKFKCPGGWWRGGGGLKLRIDQHMREGHLMMMMMMMMIIIIIIIIIVIIVTIIIALG